MEQPNVIGTVGGNAVAAVSFIASAFFCLVGVIAFNSGGWVLLLVGAALIAYMYSRSKRSSTSSVAGVIALKSAKGMMAGSGLVGIVSILGLIIDTQPQTPVRVVDHSNMAHIQCKEFVKERLKAPSSAEFAFLDFTSQALPDNEYVITANVEAQNSFGVKLKNRYRCDVKWNGSDENGIRNWTLVSLRIEE